MKAHLIQFLSPNCRVAQMDDPSFELAVSLQDRVSTWHWSVGEFCAARAAPGLSGEPSHHHRHCPSRCGSEPGGLQIGSDRWLVAFRVSLLDNVGHFVNLRDFCSNPEMSGGCQSSRYYEILSHRGRINLLQVRFYNHYHYHHCHLRWSSTSDFCQRPTSLAVVVVCLCV